MSFQGPEDRAHPGQIVRQIKVFWAKSRAWHGDKVWIRVRTENVPDGTKVDVIVFPEGRPGDVIETIADLNVTGNQASHEHEIAWKDKDMLQATDRKFQLGATLKLQHPIESDLSPPLYVDREPPSFSF